MNKVRSYGKLKIEAQNLRRDGLSYSEILKKVTVSKSTLSLWLREVGLSKTQKQQLTEKRLAAIIRGGATKRSQRLGRSKLILNKAESEIGMLSKRELWLIGTALYWGEGSKQKEYNPSVGVQFSNSDPEMIKVFLLWLKKCCLIKEDDIYFEIYIHDTFENKTKEVRKFWSEVTGYPLSRFPKIYFKHNLIKGRREKVLYYGLLRVKVRTSTDFNREISGWINGICNQIK